jgi:WD40 repeat protein
MLLSADYSGEIAYWNIDTRESRLTTRVPQNVQSIAVDRERRWLAVGTTGPDIALFQFGKTVSDGVLKGHSDRVLQMVFLKDGRTLLSTGYDGSIRRWDVEKLQQGEPIRSPGPRIESLSIWEDRADSIRLAFSTLRNDGSCVIKLDDAELEQIKASPDVVAISPDGARVACTAGPSGNGVSLWAVLEKTLLGHLPNAPFPRGLAFTPNGKYVVVMGRNETHIYEAVGGDEVARLDHSPVVPPPPAYVSRLNKWATSRAVSPDGHWLAIGTQCGSVLVWDLPALLRTVDGPD